MTLLDELAAGVENNRRADLANFDAFNSDLGLLDVPKTEIKPEVKNSIEIDTNDIVYKVARLVSKNLPEGTILKMFNITDDELNAIKQDENFELYSNESFNREHTRPINIDDKWDIIEEVATDAALDFMVKHPDSISPDDALKYAGIANRALRKKTKILTEDTENGKQTNNLSVTMNFTNDFMDKLNRLNPDQEFARVASKSGEHKMVDFMQPKEMEKVIEQHSTTKVIEAQDALSFLDDEDLVVPDDT